MFQNNKFGATGGGNLFGTQTPQNQSNLGGSALFGNRTGGAFTTPGLGAANPNANASGLFGAPGTATAAAGGGMFRTPGLTAQAGGGLFGQTQPQAGGGLFGQTAAAPAATGGMFQTQTPQQRTAGIGGGALFQTPTSQATTNSLFGGAKAQQTTTPFGNTFAATGQQQSGTAAAAFKAPQQSDTITKNNRTQTIQTRFQTITAMKEYTSKSIEELRFEDYAANRKGGQAAAATAGGGLFGGQQQQAAAGGIFGQTSQAGGMLGQQQQAAATGGLFGAQQQQQQTAAAGLFSGQQKAGGLFGQTSAATGLGGNTAATPAAGGLFGNNVQTTQTAGGIFGQAAAGQQPAAGGLFGQAAQQPAAAGGLFGQQQTQQQAGGLFGGQKATLGGLGAAAPQAGGIFGAQQQAQTGLTLGATPGAGLFSGQKTATAGLTLGGQAQTTGLTLGGAAATAGGLFGGATGGGLAGGLGGGLGGNQLKLGGTATLGGGLAGGLGGATMLGGLGAGGLGGLGANKTLTSLGGASGLKIGGGMGTGMGMGTFSAGGVATAANSQVTSLGTDATAAAQQQAQLQLQLATLHNSPFGDSPLFKTALQDAKKRNKDSPASATKASTTPSHMRVSSKAVTRLRPQALVSRPAAKASLFDGLESDVPGTLSSPDLFVPRSSVKKLVIKPKAVTSPSESVGPSPMRNSTPAKGHVDMAEASMAMQQSDGSFPRTPLGRMGIVSPPQQATTQSPDNQSGSSLTHDGSFDLPRRSGRAAGDDSARASPGQDRSSAVNLEGTLVTLAREDYYTQPPLDELAALVDEHGRLEVEDFIVGRTDLGEIRYPGTTDLTGINLDEILTISQSEVTVYPDDQRKPEVGTELNKRAIITLHGVWPNDKATGEAITSPNRLETMNYRNRVKKSTSKIGAQFIDYRAQTGSWIFQVEHFSKYGLPDEDSDAEEETTEPLKKKPLQPTGQRLTVTSLLANNQHDQQSKKPSLFGGPSLMTSLAGKQQHLETEDDMAMGTQTQESTAENSQPSSMASSRHFAASIGLNPHHVQLMKASFFAMDGDEDGMDITLGAAPSSTQIYQPSSASDRGLFAPEAGGHESPGGQSMVMRPGSAVALSPYRRPTDPPRTPAPAASASSDERAHSRSSLQMPFLAPESSSKLTTQRSAVTPRKALLGATSAWQQQAQGQQQQSKVGGLSADIVGSPMPAHIARLPILTSGQVQGGGPKNDALSVASVQRCLLPMPANRSITEKLTNVVSDAGLMFGRSFRVGWGHGWRLVHPGAAISGPAKSASGENRLIAGIGRASATQNSSYCVQIEQLHASPLLQGGGAAKERITRSMQIQLDYTDISMEGDAPLLAPTNGVEALDCHANEAKQLVDGAVTSADEQKGLEYSAQVWSLASALWGRLPATNGFASSQDTGPMESGLASSESYEERMSRRRAVSKWLSSVTAKDIGDIVQYAGGSQDDISYLKALFALLTGQQIAAACRLAVSHGDTNLARLIGQCAGGSSFRENVAVQLQQWMERKTDRFMAGERLRVYCLLAGMMVWQGSDTSVYACTCEGIDWRRAFAVHLWYASPYEASIADGFCRYLKAFKGFSDEDGHSSQAAYAAAPTPHYSTSPLVDDNDDGFQLRDMRFHLLRLYCKQTHRLQRTLDPATHTRFLLDYQLSWPLFCVLKSLHYNHMPTSLVARLHCDFASQLLSLDMWPWAVMVALYIPQTELRHGLVHEILHRCCKLSETADLTEEDEFLTEQLSVPAEWIHQAKAVRARYEGKHLLTAQHHLSAGQWMASHAIIVKHIASPAIVNGDTHVLMSMLEELEPLYRSALIPDWSRAGQVYLDYLRLSNRLLAVAAGGESIVRQEELNADIITLCTRLEHLPVCTPLDRLCQANMAKACSHFIKQSNPFPLLQSLSWCDHGHLGLLCASVAANIPVV